MKQMANSPCPWNVGHRLDGISHPTPSTLPSPLQTYPGAEKIYHGSVFVDLVVVILSPSKQKTMNDS